MIARDGIFNKFSSEAKNRRLCKILRENVDMDSQKILPLRDLMNAES